MNKKQFLELNKIDPFSINPFGKTKLKLEDFNPNTNFIPISEKIPNKWDETYMDIAKKYAEHSKCVAKKVACVIVKDNNIIGVGINGSMPGKTNCNEKFVKVRNKIFEIQSDGKLKETKNDEHHKWSLIHETHAEINALAKANKNGTSVYGGTAYITLSPCRDCAKALATFGIKRIFYSKEYDDFEEVKVYLKELGIRVYKI